MSTRTTEVAAIGRRRRLLGALIVIGLVAGGCPARVPPAPVMPTTAEKAVEIRRTIVAWLECEECDQGQLEAVVKLGEGAVPGLAASLRDGPAPARREQLRRHLEQSHARVKERSRTDAAAYVRRYTENHTALYRVRAAHALSVIGGPAARQALEEALAEPHRDDVKRSIRAALARLQKP